MTSVSERPTGTRAKGVLSTLVSAPQLWGAIAIGFMWLAALFSSIYGHDFVSVNGGGTQTTTVPTAIFIALFACLASVAVARRAFRRDTDSGDRPSSSGS